MRYLLLLIIFVLMTSNVYAVQSVTFNYEFNNSKSMAAPSVIKDDSIVLNINSDIDSSYCKYSSNEGMSYEYMEGTFDLSYQGLNKKSFSHLTEGTYKFYIRCKDENGSIGKESEVMFGIVNPVKAEILLSKSSPVNAGLLEITLKTTKQLSQKPTLSYSTDGSNYDSIPLSGSNDVWKGYILISSSLKESIGSFKFRGIDLDGIAGEEITKGEIFLIDTVNPAQINEIDAEGKDNNIYLEWRFNEDYSYFNIYRSKFPNVDYTDFYKKVEKKSFTDDDVSVGRTYYYKITAVDDAGNEGDLSYEVYSVAIDGDNTSDESGSTGLDPELIGSVDSFLYGLNDMYSDIKSVKASLNSDDENNEIISTFGLISAVDSSINEIESLEKEVKGYKNQKLTRVDLEKKLDNAQLKLNIIKKETPESVSIKSKSDFSKTYNEASINEVLISLGKNDGEASDLSKKSKEAMDKNNFGIETSVKNIEIYYMDGSKKTKGIISKVVSFNDGNNGSIIEYIPKEIVSEASDITFKDNNYNILKNDPVISFPSDTKKIIYTLDGEINLDSAKNIENFFLIEEYAKTDNGVTGFLILENGLNTDSYIFIALIFMAIIFAFYFVKTRRDKKDTALLEIIGDKLNDARLYIETKNHDKLNEIYSELNEHYKQLSDGSKSLIYHKLSNFNDQIKMLKK